MEIKDIRKFIDLIEKTDITELTWEKDGVKVTLKKGAIPEIISNKTQKATSANKGIETSSGSSDAEKKENSGKENITPQEEGLVTIKAPIVGTFYRTSAPDTPFFVEEGGFIEKGQKVCVLEAMKVMKEITSEVSGKISKVLVENGAHLEYGQDIFLIDMKAKK